MFRILGFILGSAVAMAGILLVLGVPEFHLSNSETNQARFDAALSKIREKRPDIEKAVDELVADLQQSDQPPPASQPQIVATQDVPLETSENPSQAVTLDIPDEAEPADAAYELVNNDQQWHELWNPFRSEIAARGFVSQLEKVTGLDYRIIKVKAGVYQVGFAFADDAERMAKLSQISAATGLDLP